ncbi:kinase-like protein [Dendrothele bispora CBS 962.96]|uniref:Kinase-like protein n=1 Tax=Dendrothele bispora (strain CBS 962.96) TaxID=1314807 RepID=A0A4S8KIH0_DENBC|nr:kinase-like protein [Dendrothele bispora CBS 962.96]
MTSDEDFRLEIDRIRNEDLTMKKQSNLYTDHVEMYFGATFLEVWYEDKRYVKIHDIPGTLSGNILRLRASLPPLDTPKEIIGNDVAEVVYKDIPPEEDWDDQDASEVTSRLPVVTFDAKLHFAKKCRCVNEVQNLLAAQGNPHIVDLLGRTQDGLLVFPLYEEEPWIFFFRTKAIITDYRRLFLQLANAVIYLHDRGIIHRDLALRNILVSRDHQNLILCDLESRYGSHVCPEIALARDQRLPEQDLPYSEKTDVFCFGTTMADFILATNVRTPWQYTDNFVPPKPFDVIFRACIRHDPADRPSMSKVREMLQSIDIPGTQ